MEAYTENLGYKIYLAVLYTCYREDDIFLVQLVTENHAVEETESSEMDDPVFRYE